MQHPKEATSYRLQLYDRIQEAATAAFAEQGIRAVKMDDIAHTLGISKRTLYEVYNDKEQLLYECIKQRHEQQQERIRRMEEEKACSVLDIVLEYYRIRIKNTHSVNPRFYEDLQKYPRVMAYLKDFHERSRKGFVSFLKRGVEEGYFRSDLNYELMPHLFEAIGQRIMQEQLYSRYSMKELYANFMFVAFRGFCTEKGVKELDAAMI